MKRIVTVTQQVEVDIDEAALTDESLQEYRDCYYELDIDGHFKNLGWMHAVGIASGSSFIEGYGEPKEMGIGFTLLSTETDID